MGEELYKDEEWLREQLVDKERTPGEVAGDFDITRATINHWKRKFDITLPTDWTKDEVEYLKEHAQEMSAPDIAKELGRTRASVNHYANRHNISMEKPHSAYADKISEGRKEYSCDENFFSQDTPEANYWAGALLADGCVRERDENSHTIKLHISKKDSSWLRKFKESLEAEHPIREDGDFIRLKVHSNDMFNDLKRFGVVPRKTYGNSEPEIKDEMMSHFIRGLLDGDGSITKNNKRGSVKVNLVNSKAICNWVNDNVDRLINISGCLYPHSCSDVAWNWEITDRKDLEKFGNWLYDDTDLFMERKYKRYNNYGIVS